MNAQIQYVQGDITKPVETGDARYIVHIVNDRGGFGRGVAHAIAEAWPNVRNRYLEWYRVGSTWSSHLLFDESLSRRSPFELGEYQIVQVDSAPNPLYVVNILAQHGYRSAQNPVPFQVDYAYKALKSLAYQIAYGSHPYATVHMPRIGCGLGGSSWNLVETMVHQALVERSVNVYVYDLAEGN